MNTVTTYEIYISGQSPDNVMLSGDIDPQTKQITIQSDGSAMIVCSIEQLTDSAGNPLTFGSDPITFEGGQPPFIAWAVLSPTQLLLTDFNWNQEQTTFNFNATSLITDGETGETVTRVVRIEQLDVNGVAMPIDPTIVNTYVPPPGDGGLSAKKACCAPVVPIRRIA